MKSRFYRLASLLALSMVLTASMPATVVASPKSLPKVTVAVAQSEKVLDQIPITGTLVAREEVHINAQLSGVQIQQIHVETGEQVRQGDVLIELESQDLRNQLARIDTEVLRAEAGIRQSISRIAANEASFKLASNSVKRNIELSKSNSVAQSTLDDSRAAADQAAARWAMAKEDLAIAQAEFANWHVQHEAAQLNISRTVLTAPVSGIITARATHVGAIVSAGGEPLLTLVMHGEIELAAEVLETALSRIQVGDAAQFTLADGAIREGEVRFVSPSVDTHTRLGLVKISIADKSDTWFGSFATGWLLTNEYDALTIPARAVQSTEKGDVVSVVNAGVIEKRSVVAGIEFHGRREILDGLLKGEHVLAKASSFYQDGDRVSIVSPVKDITVSSAIAPNYRTSGGVL